jgi:hypothetical protein
MKPLVVRGISRHGWPAGAQAFDRRRLRPVSRRGLECDPGSENAREIGHAEQQDKEHRKSEGEFDERLPSWPGVNLTAPSPSEMSQ